ncbi:MAG TPA: hypothetical protein VLH41_06695, partial [Thermoanaerobaculia bacterium]|nr:hypothetical protein [Thermoanaerobaculia bacterium]
MPKAAACAALCLCLAFVFALPATAEPLAVKCGRLLDPATKSVKTNATVAIDRRTVVAAAPAGATVLDLSALTC